MPASPPGTLQVPPVAPGKRTMDAQASLLPSLSSDRRGGSCPRLSVKVAGLFALGGLIWSWVLQAEASQALQEKIQFSKPFFIVCFNHTATAVLLPLAIVYFKLFGSPLDRYETSWLDVSVILQRHSVLPLRQLVRIALLLSVFYCAADYFWYAALTGVSVAAGTAIFNCSPLFVYCFSICFLGERISMRKIYGVIIAFTGVTLILMHQDSATRLDLAALKSESFLGGVLVVVSAALYGGYEVAFKVILGAELTDTATIVILTGLSGLLTIPVWIMGSLVLAFSPFDSLYEPLGWPTSTDGLALLFLSGSLAVLFNVCMPLSLCWTSPLETSVGCMLTIPLSGALDVVLHSTKFSSECIAGSVLVMAGFGVLEYASKPSGESEDESDLGQPEEERFIRVSRRSSSVYASPNNRYTTL